ncbi:MAG: diaminohydroxyphosphoribosylaminopyrimidine deaminase [Rickettsiales bacterium]|jgi:diaminohydroxyphosphoribosylaminopyrimidine deaminase/5-amino-6-(5-phosphoribosylamino)uracil reductase
MKNGYFDPKDQFFMNFALNISKKNIGITKNNPSVGCVLVKNNIIISTGITGENGVPHAENIAILKAGKNAKGATAYVTLEPCSHFGKTPPCSDAIIEHGISRVVIATADPDKRVNGSGIEKLKSAGIEIVTGVLGDEARKINQGFFSARQKNRPFITLKLATSFDGKIAHNYQTQNEENRWISSPQSQNFAHLLRSKNDAILVGANTIINDDPSLDCRLSGLRNYSPKRIIMSSNLNFGVHSKIFQNTKSIPTYIATNNQNTNKFEEVGVKIIHFKENDLKDFVQKLPQIGINNLLIEGGSIVAAEFFKAGLIDKFIHIRSDRRIGDGGISAICGFDLQHITKNFQTSKYRKISTDLITEFTK